MRGRPTITDEQMALSGLSQADLRRLITWGAVKPDQAGGGHGRIRLWSERSFRYAVYVGAMKSAGLSLRMSHTIGYVSQFFLGGSLFDSPSLPYDRYVVIANTRWVFADMVSMSIWIRTEDPPATHRLQKLIGEIQEGGLIFTSERDLEHSGFGATTEAWGDGAIWHGDIDGASLAWKHKPDIDEAAARRALAEPLSELRINIDLHLRMAHRGLSELPMEHIGLEAAD